MLQDRIHSKQILALVGLAAISAAFGVLPVPGKPASLTAEQAYARMIRAKMRDAPLSPEENTTKVAELAAKVRRAYESCSNLSLRAEITEPPSPVIKHVQMSSAPCLLKTRAYIDGELVLVFTLRDGLFEEWKAAWNGVPEMHQIRAAESPDGPADIELADGLERHACGFGSCYKSWLGPGAEKVNHFVNRMTSGTYVGVEMQNGRECDVVACPPNESYGGLDVLFVRPDGFVASWRTIVEFDDKPARLIRIRNYSEYRTAMLRPETWRFEKPLSDLLPPASHTGIATRPAVIFALGSTEPRTP